ncbi:MAG: carbonic anhydrase [Spirochaetia bacterium]|nr:carbonic anhydrase [Spirochaetia bacterium]
MERLIEINKPEDFPQRYQDTNIAKLIEYHNFNKPQDDYENAELLIGMCMDHRKSLNIPTKFAYILRTGGANMKYSLFKISFAIAIGKIKTIAIIGHTQCGMVDLASKKEEFIQSLVENAGITQSDAKEHFNHYTKYEIGNEVDFVLSEVKRLREIYPKILIAPLIYKVEDDHLYLIKE